MHHTDHIYGQLPRTFEHANLARYDKPALRLERLLVIVCSMPLEVFLQRRYFKFRSIRILSLDHVLLLPKVRKSSANIMHFEKMWSAANQRGANGC